MWNYVVEKVNTDCAVTSTKGKLQALQKCYRHLGRMCDSDFDSEQKEQVETKVNKCSSLLFEDEYQDGELHEGEIEKCIWKLRNNKNGESLFGTKKLYRSAA